MFLPWRIEREQLNLPIIIRPDYVTVNMIPHNEDLTGLPEYLHQLEKLGVDALIVSDPES